MRKGSCRDELLSSIRTIVKSKGKKEFAPKEVIDFMKNNNTVYKESTI
jgi:hypothetical protein